MYQCIKLQKLGYSEHRIQPITSSNFELPPEPETPKPSGARRIYKVNDNGVVHYMIMETNHPMFQRWQTKPNPASEQATIDNFKLAQFKMQSIWQLLNWSQCNNLDCNTMNCPLQQVVSLVGKSLFNYVLVRNILLIVTRSLSNSKIRDGLDTPQSWI